MLHRDEYWERAQQAAERLRALGCEQPFAAIQCGSGLSPLIEALWPEGPGAAGGGRCAFSEIPHLASAGVAGHGSEILWGRVAGPQGGKRWLLVFSGRLHLYEGHSPLEAAFPVAICAAVSSRFFILTNAAGGLNQHFGIGDVMLQSDFINFQHDNPLQHLHCPAPQAPRDGASAVAALTRFADPKPAYHQPGSRAMGRYLEEQGLSVHDGVYIGVRGPMYETRAELVMFRSLGADAIGMSSVQELTLCHFFRLPAIGLSLITNECFSSAAVTHGEVLSVSRAAAGALGRAVGSFAANWEDSPA